MRKNLGVKPCLYPEPVLIIGTYDEDGTPNAMNAAWGGIHNDDEICICLSADHKTVGNLLKRGAFTVSFATVDTVIPCDYVGIVSGNDVKDKFAKAGFTAVKSEFVDAPIIQELKMSVECTVKSYENEELIGKIVNASVDESVLTDGRVDVSKLRPVVYDGLNRDYLEIKGKVGKAFSDGKKLIRE